MSLLNKGVRETPVTDSDFTFKRLLHRVRSACAERRLLSPGCSVLLAVSGGADSVFMVWLLRALAVEMGVHLHIAHFDHCLRGEESARDARFVAELAEDMGIPFSLGSGDVIEKARACKISVQEAARILRYRFLEDLRVGEKIDFIATAHNADDQAEEVLARLLRGSALQGLAGIPWKRGCVIRPLLGIKALEIRNYLLSRGIAFVEDSTNRELKYQRNRIRHSLVPFLKQEFNPAITETLGRTADLLSQDMDLLDTLADDEFKRCCRRCPPDKKDVEFDCVVLRELHPAIRKRLYRKALSHSGWLDGRLGSRHLLVVDRIVKGNSPSASANLPGRIVAERQYDSLFIRKIRDKSVDVSPCYQFEVKSPGTYELPDGCGTVELFARTTPQTFKTGVPCEIYLSSRAVRFPLTIRSRIPGDRFSPRGRGFECRLKKFLINRKIPRKLRNCMPLLVTHEGIAAAGGVEAAGFAAASPGEKQSICFRWRLENDG